MFAGLLLFAIQIYNIFPRNPNRVNTSQHSRDCLFAAICSSEGLKGVILRGALCGGRLPSVRKGGGVVNTHSFRYRQQINITYGRT